MLVRFNFRCAVENQVCSNFVNWHFYISHWCYRSTWLCCYTTGVWSFYNSNSSRCRFHQHFTSRFFKQKFFSAFLCLQFGFVAFSQKNIGAKAARKMLVKLATALSKLILNSQMNPMCASNTMQYICNAGGINAFMVLFFNLKYSWSS